MHNYQNIDDFYEKMQIVKTMQRRMSKLRESIPKNLRNTLSSIERVQSKMFGACQSYFSYELEEASLGEPCFDTYVGLDDY